MNDEGEHKPGKLGGVYYRRGKRGIFTISYQDDRGKERWESTHTTDEVKAAKILEDRRRKVIACQENGTRFQSPTVKRITIAECLNQWEVQQKLHGKWSDTYVGDKKALLARFGNLTVRELTKARIQEYQLSEKEGLSTAKSLSRNAQLNRHLCVLASSIRVAGLTPEFASDMKVLRLREPPPRTGFFTAQEFAILHSSLPDAVADLVLGLFLTGWRVGELAGSTILKQFRPGVVWSENKDPNWLFLPASRNKGRQDKKIPLTGELRALINRRREKRVPGCDLIFCRNSGKPLKDFWNAWRKACKACGKPNGLVHDLRRSRARILIRAGVPTGTCMALGGWRDPNVFSRYDVISRDDMREAQEQTERFLEREMEEQGGAKPIYRAVN